MKSTFTFSIELKHGLEKPDYIIRLKTPITIGHETHGIPKISESINMNNTVNVDHEISKSTIINLIYNDRNIIEHSTSIKEEFVKRLKEIKNLKLKINISENQTQNQNEYLEIEIEYSKYNDLKFFRIFKNILNEYKSLYGMTTYNYKHNIEETYINSNSINYYCDCEIYNPKYNIEGYYVHESELYASGENYRNCCIYKLLHNEYKYAILLYMSIDDDNFKYNFHYVCCTDSNKNNDEEYISYKISDLIKYYSRVYNILNETIDESKEIDFSNVKEDLKKKEELEFENVGLKDEISRLKKDMKHYENYDDKIEKFEKLEKEYEELKNEYTKLKMDLEISKSIALKNSETKEKLEIEYSKLKKINDELLNENVNLYLC